METLLVEKVKIARKAVSPSQSAAGRDSGVSQTVISLLESGQVNEREDIENV